MNRWMISYMILMALWFVGNVAFDEWQKYQNTMIFRSIQLGDLNIQYMVPRKDADIVDVKIVMMRGEPWYQFAGPTRKEPFSIQNIKVEYKSSEVPRGN